MRAPIVLVASERHVERTLALGDRALTWRAFVRKWATAELKPATPETVLMATALSLGDLSDPPGASGGLSLAQAVNTALGSLRQSGIAPRALASLPSARARWLGQVLARTDERLAQAGLFDERRAGWLAARSLAEAPRDALPARVVIDGLLHWDGASCAWVEALAARVPVVVRMARPKDTRFVEFARAVDVVLSRLEARWQHLSSAPDLELHEVAVPARVRLIEAASEAAQARALARAVAEQLAEGIFAERVLVLVPSLDEALLEPLRAAFSDAGIVLGEPRGKPPRSAPAVHAALTWLELISAPLHRNRLIELLESDALDPSAFIDGDGRLARRKRTLALVRRLARMPVGSDPEGALMLDILQGHVEDRGADAWMLQTVSALVQRVRAAQRVTPRHALWLELTSVWHSFGLAPADLTTVDAWVHSASRREAAMLAHALREQAVAFRALLTAGERVVQAAAALGAAEDLVSASTFLAELTQALDHVSLPATARPGCVRVVRAFEAAGCDSDVLIVVNANEGSFLELSASAPATDEELREAYPPHERPLAASDLVSAARVELLSAVSSTRLLLVSRSLTDDQGRRLAPAGFFAEFCAAFPVEREPASLFHASGAALSAHARELSALGRGYRSPDPDVARRVDVELERARFFADPTVAAGPASGLIELAEIDPEVFRDAVGGTVARPIPATAIERAAQCRFAAFAGRVLGAGGEDELGEGLEPWQRGSLIHRGLHAAFEAVDAGWDQLPRDQVIASAMAAARAALLHRKRSLLYEAEVDRALRDVTAVVVWSLEDGSGFRFAHGERAFGEAAAEGQRVKNKARESASWPPLIVGDGSQRIRVRGRIDRVDLSRDGSRARVLDYKSGALPAWKDVGTIWFQPALYALAVWQHFGRLSVTEMRAVYLDTSRRPPRILPAEKNQVIGIEDIAQADRSAASIVGKLWRGDVAPRPWHASVCTRCSVRDVCRRPAAMPIEELEPESEGS